MNNKDRLLSTATGSTGGCSLLLLWLWMDVRRQEVLEEMAHSGRGEEEVLICC